MRRKPAEPLPFLVRCCALSFNFGRHSDTHDRMAAAAA